MPAGPLGGALLQDVVLAGCRGVFARPPLTAICGLTPFSARQGGAGEDSTCEEEIICGQRGVSRPTSCSQWQFCTSVFFHEGFLGIRIHREDGNPPATKGASFTLATRVQVLVMWRKLTRRLHAETPASRVRKSALY